MAAVMVIVTAAIAIMMLSGRRTCLVLYNDRTGERIADYLVDKGEAFSIEFIHSVNRSMVRDYYELTGDGHICNTECVYYAFGAGVETELSGEETLSYGNNGEMIISNINKNTDSLIYVVGTVSDHILRYGDEVISLRDLCGRNVHVRFENKYLYLGLFIL